MGFKLKLIFLLFVVKNVVGSEMREAGYENEEPLSGLVVHFLFA